MATIQGTAGDDSLVGTAGGDDFHMEQGGDDTVSGGDGIDVFYFGRKFDAGDHVDGGAGTDYLVLDGDYSAGMAFAPDSLANVEVVQLIAGHDYSLSGLSDANLVSGKIVIDASDLRVSDVLTFDASDVSALGAVSVLGGLGDDVITGGDGNDTLAGGGGQDLIRGGLGSDAISGGNGSTLGGGQGNDSISIVGGPAIVQGGEGDDFITMASFAPGTVIDGGDGANDEVIITGDHLHFTLDAAMITNVEYVGLGNYDKVKLAADLVPHGQTLEVAIDSIDHFAGGLRIDGHLARGDLHLVGGGLRDVLTGGAGDDTISGVGHNDVITGGKGADLLSGGHQYGHIPGATFIYKSVNDSKAAAPDEITGLANDQFIDLHKIDADTNTAGDQAFHLAAKFTGVAGQLVFDYDSHRDITSISGDVDGDGVADFTILADGSHSDFTHFIL